MLEVRRSAERGFFDHGWLKTYHTFSFADFYDPAWVEYGPLRVINDDRVAPGQGFGKHGHRDMEIVTYILAGELAHQDSMGNGSVIRVGDVQRMSAGTGVTHSEFNPSAAQEVHLLQIWIQPDAQRLAPGYEQRNFSAADKRGRLRLIGSRDGADGSVVIHQNARVYAGLFDGVERADFELPPAGGRGCRWRAAPCRWARRGCRPAMARAPRDRRASACTAAVTPKCWCLTCRRRVPQVAGARSPGR